MLLIFVLDLDANQTSVTCWGLYQNRGDKSFSLEQYTGYSANDYCEGKKEILYTESFPQKRDIERRSFTSEVMVIVKLD